MKIYHYGSKSAKERLTAIAGRGLDFKKKDLQAVMRILEDVRKNGDHAVIQYARRFDSPDLSIESIQVTQKEIDSAIGQVDPLFIRSLNRAIRQIRSFHKRQLSQSWLTTDRAGTVLGQLINPVDSAGIYVPGGLGGKTPLVSSVLMNAIPAKIAGVKQIVMVTPSTPEGGVSPYILTAAKKAGVNTIFKMGSAWAIAALAYGTETVPKVDVIVGPGNIYVTLAKKIVAGTVGIDMIAGPSEILIVADESANPEFVAADLLSQAEHDPLSSAMLITDSKTIAQATSNAVTQQLMRLERKEIAQKSIRRYGMILVVPDLKTALLVSNRIAPEHLELHIKDPLMRVGEIRHAGAVFLGSYTPEPMGDYVAGPNHILPTAGTARFSSALSVDHFIKKTSMISYSETAFRREANDVIRLAQVEGLDAHANAVRIRLNQNNDSNG
jgi:histidinol dehydrogenase